MDNILVIGSTGNIGFPLVKFLNDSVNVVAATSNVARNEEKFKEFENVKLVEFDFLNKDTYEQALLGVNKVFFVRPPQLGNPQEEIFPFLDYLKKVNIEHIVFVSLLGVENNKKTPHYKIEEYIETQGFNYTFIRPSFFMQNIITTHLDDLNNNHDLFIPAGKALTSFIDTDDIGYFASVILTNTDEHKFKKYDITGPDAITYYEVADILNENTDYTYTYSKPSLFKFRRTLLKRGELKDKVNVMVMLYFITRLGNAKDVTTTYYDVTNKQPTTFKEFVIKNKDVFK